MRRFSSISAPPSWSKPRSGWLRRNTAFGSAHTKRVFRK